MPRVYQQNFRIQQFECDPWDRMSPGAMLRRIQEIGTEQCESLGFDMAYYKRTHTAFLLSKVSLQIYRPPAIGQQVLLETRAYGMRRAVYHRVTSFHAENGEKLCETDSRWLLVDTDTARILRHPQPDFEPCFNDEPTEEHDMTLPKAEGAPATTESFTAGYSLCDRNGHINNTRYADLMCDALPLKAMQATPPQKLLLCYHHEIPLGDAFTLQAFPTCGGSCFAASRNAKKKPADFEGFIGF